MKIRSRRWNKYIKGNLAKFQKENSKTIFNTTQFKISQWIQQIRTHSRIWKVKNCSPKTIPLNQDKWRPSMKRKKRIEQRRPSKGNSLISKKTSIASSITLMRVIIEAILIKSVNLATNSSSTPVETLKRSKVRLQLFLMLREKWRRKNGKIWCGLQWVRWQVVQYWR